jgi:hypothetical protein
MVNAPISWQLSSATVNLRFATLEDEHDLTGSRLREYGR